MANNGGFWLEEISMPIRQAGGTPWRVDKLQKAKSPTIRLGQVLDSIRAGCKHGTSIQPVHEER
jgi:hypothetical protein